MQGTEQGGRRARIVIVDDSDVLVETLVDALAPHPVVQVVATASDGPTAVAAVAAHEPDVVLMDLRLGDVWGLDLVPELRARAHPPAVVVFTASAEPAVVGDPARTGVAAQITKGAPLQELVEVLVAAARSNRTGRATQS